jgi:thymidylate synthase (FAD)
MSDEVTATSGMFRPNVPEIDALLGVPLHVLDDGFVRVVDYMGNDTSVVQAARVSYGIGTKRVREDRGLIRYLMRHAHTTPFEMRAQASHSHSYGRLEAVDSPSNRERE